MTETAMTLRELRDHLGLGQHDFAKRMGIPYRTYQDIESGTATVRPVYMHAAERAALAYAVEAGNPMLAPKTIRTEAVSLARMLFD